MLCSKQDGVSSHLSRCGTCAAAGLPERVRVLLTLHFLIALGSDLANWLDHGALLKATRQWPPCPWDQVVLVCRAHGPPFEAENFKLFPLWTIKMQQCYRKKQSKYSQSPFRDFLINLSMDWIPFYFDRSQTDKFRAGKRQGNCLTRIFFFKCQFLK